MAKKSEKKTKSIEVVNLENKLEILSRRITELDEVIHKKAIGDVLNYEIDAGVDHGRRKIEKNSISSLRDLRKSYVLQAKSLQKKLNILNGQEAEDREDILIGFER